MTSSRLAAKTAKLLLDGKVTLLTVDDPGTAIADVLGSVLTHRVTLSRGGFACTCTAFRYGQRCSHITAVAMVVDHPCRRDAVAAVNS